MSRITLGNMKTTVPEDSQFRSCDKNDPWNIDTIQCYNPIYSVFLPLNEDNFEHTSWRQQTYLVDPYHIVNENFPNDKIPCNMHIKSAPLIDPIHYLIGKYDSEKDKIKKIVENLKAGGLTAGGSGIKLGYKQTLNSKIPDGDVVRR